MMREVRPVYMATRSTIIHSFLSVSGILLLSALYHITSRGNCHEDIYPENEDRQQGLELFYPGRILRNVNFITVETDLSFCPSSALHKQLHSSLYACLYALKMNRNPASNFRILLNPRS